MVRLILCRCIRILTQVSEFVVVLAPLCLEIVAVWSPSTSWNTTSDEFVTYHRVGLETHIPNNQTLYYAMKKVSSGSGAIYDLSLIIGGSECQ